MEKWMCYGTLGIAVLMLIVFLMDMFAKEFRRAYDEISARR